MTPPQIVLYAFIGGLLAFAAISLISLILMARWMRNTPPPRTSLNYTPAARTPYVNGTTAEKEQTQ